MKMDSKNLIAARVAREFKNGDYINLGIGIPTLVAGHLPQGVEIVFLAENGLMGIGPLAAEGQGDCDLINASCRQATALPGGAVFDSAMFFSIARGGHLEATVLGALEVDQEGNMANWIIPGKLVPGMGGAMDLAVGAKRVIVAMEHTNKGRPKILRRCSLPLTAVKAVSMIVTELAVFQFLPELTLTELAPGVTEADVRAATEADYAIARGLSTMVV